MRKTLLITIIIIICSFPIWSQTLPPVQVEGRVIDKSTSLPLADATVILLHARDSSRAASGFTDTRGVFLLEQIKPGAYQLYITFLGYQMTLRPLEVLQNDTLIDLGTVAVQRTGVTLKAIEIVEIRWPMVVKKDTLEFNADYYKTRENAVMEELLKKLPGVQVERDGTIKVNGQTVKRILVNGKPFFGDDPKMVIRNLPAEIIDKVQLIDRKPDQPQYVSTSEERTEKAINITVKKDKKDNFLGRLSAGYGTDSRFAANGSLNRFSDEEQMSFVGGGNNVNGQEFLEGSGQRIGIGGNGITRSWNGGVNYSNDLGKRIRVSSSYVVNDSRTQNQQNSARQNLLPDTTYYYNQEAYSINTSKTHNLDTRIEYKPDTLHTLSVNTNVGYTQNTIFVEDLYESLDGKHQMVNTGTFRNTSADKGFSVFSMVSMERKFRKTGRNLSTFLSLGAGNNDKEGFNRSSNLFVHSGGSMDSDTIDQRNELTGSNRQFSVMVIYTEPILKHYFLELGYSYTSNEVTSRKHTFYYNASKQLYDRQNDSLSNEFESLFSYHMTGVRIRTQKDKYDYGIGLYIQASALGSNNISKAERLQKYYFNLVPVISFTYAFTNNNRLRLFYNGSLQQPPAEQLQPVPNNSNPLYIQQGNAHLKAGYNHNISLHYNALNPASTGSFTINANIVFTGNKIINANRIDTLGRQVSLPVNVNGAYNASTNITKTFPLRKQQTAIITSTAFNFNKDVNIINGEKGSIRNFNLAQGVSLNYTHKSLFDVAFAATATYNGVQYSLQKNNNSNYFSYAFSLGYNVNIPLGIAVGGNLDYVLNAGRSAGYNQGITMLNAFVSKSLFTHKQGLMKLSGVDLLGQNLSVGRQTGENYIEDRRSTVLKRFFMLSFSYFLKPAISNK